MTRTPQAPQSVPRFYFKAWLTQKAIRVLDPDFELRWVGLKYSVPYTARTISLPSAITVDSNRYSFDEPGFLSSIELLKLLNASCTSIDVKMSIIGKLVASLHLVPQVMIEDLIYSDMAETALCNFHLCHSIFLSIRNLM